MSAEFDAKRAAVALQYGALKWVAWDRDGGQYFDLKGEDRSAFSRIFGRVTNVKGGAMGEALAEAGGWKWCGGGWVRGADGGWLGDHEWRGAVSRHDAQRLCFEKVIEVLLGEMK